MVRLLGWALGTLDCDRDLQRHDYDHASPSEGLLQTHVNARGFRPSPYDLEWSQTLLAHG